jgi:hypothetical protein
VPNVELAVVLAVVVVFRDEPPELIREVALLKAVDPPLPELLPAVEVIVEEPSELLEVLEGLEAPGGVELPVLPVLGLTVMLVLPAVYTLPSPRKESLRDPRS